MQIEELFIKIFQCNLANQEIHGFLLTMSLYSSSLVHLFSKREKSWYTLIFKASYINFSLIAWKVKVLVTQLCVTLCSSTHYSPPGSSVNGILQARILESVAIPLLQWIFPTQGSNQGLLHCRQILYQLSYQGSLFRFTPINYYFRFKITSIFQMLFYLYTKLNLIGRQE